MPAPPRFAADELQRILHDPPDSVHARSLHILPGPTHHRFDRIDVRYVGTGRPGGQRRSARIGEQVQHARSGAQPADFAENELPVLGLLGEKPHMLERGKPHAEFQAHSSSVFHEPTVGHARAKRPLASLAAAAVTTEHGVGPCPPLVLAERAVPNGLRLGTREDVASETLEFLETAAVQQLVVLPAGSGQQLGPHSVPGRSLIAFHNP